MDSIGMRSAIANRLDRLERKRGMRRGVKCVRDLSTEELLAMVADIIPSARTARSLADVDEAEILRGSRTAKLADVSGPPESLRARVAFRDMRPGGALRVRLRLIP
jgi:hypothetical protein